ncbi:peptidyl-tRNA hydrolase [Breoghania corrubedonensis]|uniref:Peptidyl-tRNA hydrolase n=1 Tax=Breoghania corrubedonensis TaxID=665038 RepID=A0A2T5UNV3_9HYPH|nr:aminoacyl-tRNA hydrolase [Breoghania corrubedonensis]PTW53187.1 peptidyl-tRNA hydrolase [Breoghania corrubedonensis]
MLVIVGLGNPGTQYAKNRHNIGFMAVDAIHRRNPSFTPWRKRFQAETSEGNLAGEKVILLKPQTYMNESGQAVGAAMRFFKLSPSDITVLYDELDLVPGKVKIKVGGGSGGHNGIKSIDAHIGKDYRRVRLGIGHPGSKERVTGYVLGDFAKVDQDWLEPLLDTVADNADLLVHSNDGEFMNRVHKAVTGKGDNMPEGSTPAGRPKAARTGQSHIRQARTKAKPEMPKEGPLAAMLKGLLGSKDSN